MKNQLLLLFIITFCSCSKNILTLHNKPHYKEEFITYKSENTQVDSSLSSTPLNFKNKEIIISQRVDYNKTTSIDEEYEYHLVIRILDSSLLKTNEKFEITNSPNIIKCEYQFTSVWSSWNKPQNKISGWIKVKEWNNQYLLIEQKIRVNDLLNDEKINFKGTRKIKVDKKEFKT